MKFTVSEEIKKAWKSSQVLWFIIEILLLVAILTTVTSYSWLVVLIYGFFMFLHQIMLIASGFKNETELIKEDEND